MSTSEVIMEFSGRYSFLSNFFRTRCVVGPPWTPSGDAIVFPSVENAYQACKTDLPSFTPDLLSCSSARARKIGQSLLIREGWEATKVSVMASLVASKFAESDALAELLLKTGKAMLVEGNHWGDRFWGFDLKRGCGQNILGQILMEVRSEL